MVTLTCLGSQLGKRQPSAILGRVFQTYVIHPHRFVGKNIVGLGISTVIEGTRLWTRMKSGTSLLSRYSC
jgi:hypothetical protein